jgi:hypothetical protein
MKEVDKLTQNAYVGFEVVTAVKMSIVVFWVVTPCGLSPPRPHDLTAQKTMIQ